MNIFNWLITACWIVFIVVWFISAFGAKRTVRYGSNVLWFMRIAALLVILAIARSGLYTYASFSPAVINPALGALGVLLCALGIGFAIWARLHLGSNWGMPMSIKEHPDLVMTGPYALVRHPIYSGMILAMLGTALVVGLWWLMIFAVSFVYFAYSATQEEARMTREFPQQYPEYKKRTKMLIPFLF